MMEVGHAVQLSVRRDQEELTLKITAQDFNVALPSQGGPHVMVRGLTVRTLSPAEWSGLRITDRTGLRVEEIAPDSPLREVLEKGTVILNAGEKDGELEAVDTPETLDALLTRYATQGGWLTVAGRNGDTEWKEFPPLMR